jgi:hypothetical protein
MPLATAQYRYNSLLCNQHPSQVVYSYIYMRVVGQAHQHDSSKSFSLATQTLHKQQ